MSIPRAACEPLDLCARSIRTLVGIAIEHTEDRVVAVKFLRPLFGALDDTDRCDAFRIVSDHHLR
jgi:hypothetical protein